MSKLILIGHPVGHSKSPAVHQAVFDAMGLDWEFGLTDIAAPHDARAFLKAADYVGLSVTTPYKPLAAEVVDICAASARLAGGANVVANRKGTLLGSNVDGKGAVSYLEHRGVSFAGKVVAVCGTGPTARSCLHAAAVGGADELVLLSRNKDRAQSVLQDYLDLYGQLAHAGMNLPAEPGRRSFLETFEQAKFLYGSYATSAAAIRAADIVMDATTLGMREGDPAPFDTDLLHEGQTVFDVCYMRRTALLQGADRAGCATFDGRAMLLGQATIAQDLWFEAQGVACTLGWDERVALMAEAAGFAVPGARD